MVAGLGHPEAGFREQAARILAETAGPGSVEALLAYLEPDVDIHVEFLPLPLGDYRVKVYNPSIHIVRALGRIGDRRSRPVLEKWRDTPIQRLTSNQWPDDFLDEQRDLGALQMALESERDLGIQGSAHQQAVELAHRKRMRAEARAVLDEEVHRLRVAIAEALRRIPSR